MFRLRLLLTPALFLMLSMPSRIARGDSTATAQDLFDRGLAELKLEHYAIACPALRESYRMDPQTGTLFTLAECEARAGQVASASAHFGAYLESVAVLSASEQTRQAARVNAALARREELKPLVPHLTIGVPPETPADSSVLLDGSAVPRVNWNVPLATDPGDHVLELVLADGRSSVTPLKLEPGASLAVSVLLPEPSRPATRAAPTPAPPAKPAPTAPAAPPIAPAAPPTAPAHHANRPWSYVAFGVGSAGLLAGSIAGAILISKRNTVSGHCDGKLCDDSGYASTRDVPTLDTVANVGFGVAVLGAAVGVVLLMTDHGSGAAHARFRPSLALDRHGGGAGLGGAF